MGVLDKFLDIMKLSDDDDYDDDYESDDDFYYYRKDGSKAKMSEDDVKEIKRETLEMKKDK